VSEPEPPAEPRILGEVQAIALKGLRPNGWNPNRMTDFEMESLRHGMRTKGWPSSQALLVWGTDETGQRRDIIIDGEHRWHCARAVGFISGPAVVLDGLTEKQAKQWTIELDQKRGRFEDTALAVLMRDIAGDAPTADMGIELGFPEDDLKRLLGVLPTDADWAAALEDQGDGSGGATKSITFLMSVEDYDRLLEHLGKHDKNKNEALIKWLRASS
jgi:hypothetical protein